VARLRPADEPPNAADPMSTPAAGSPPAGGAHRLGTVMLIDDSDVDLLYARLMIERAAVARELLSFEEAGEALAHLQGGAGETVDVILLDINMPGMDGFEFLQALHGPQQRLPVRAVVVMLSSSPDPRDHARAMGFPSVKGYLTKPLTLDAARELWRWAAS